MIGDTLIVCDCPTKDALLCKDHPDCRPSYCKMRLFDPPICKHSWETDPHGDVICEICHDVRHRTDRDKNKR